MEMVSGPGGVAMKRRSDGEVTLSEMRRPEHCEARNTGRREEARFPGSPSCPGRECGVTDLLSELLWGWDPSCKHFISSAAAMGPEVPSQQGDASIPS